MRLKIFSILCVVCFSLGAWADQLAGFAGLNSTQYTGGASWSREFGVELGATYLKTISRGFYVRTGAGYVQKKSEAGSTLVDIDYLEIPATLMLDVHPQWSIIGGLNFDIKLTSSPSSVHGTETFVVNLPIGVRYNLSGPHNLEGLLEFGLTNIASANNTSSSIGNSLIFRYLYTFKTN